MADHPARLTFDVYVAPQMPTVSDDPPPGAEREFSLRCTRPRRLGCSPWKAPDRGYIAHGHGDHRFGLGTILDRFPDARAFAVPAVIEQMGRRTRMEVMEAGHVPADLPYRT
jgi:glyoxylase-like metal-dependent hydrolase (beta-lactamase superfamily II)